MTHLVLPGAPFDDTNSGTDGSNPLSCSGESAVVTMPANGAAGRRGYGTELIGRLLRYDLGAETRLEFGPDEVHCMIAVPIGG